MWVGPERVGLQPQMEVPSTPRGTATKKEVHKAPLVLDFQTPSSHFNGQGSSSHARIVGHPCGLEMVLKTKDHCFQADGYVIHAWSSKQNITSPLNEIVGHITGTPFKGELVYTVAEYTQKVLGFAPHWGYFPRPMPKAKALIKDHP